MITIKEFLKIYSDIINFDYLPFNIFDVTKSVDFWDIENQRDFTKYYSNNKLIKTFYKTFYNFNYKDYVVSNIQSNKNFLENTVENEYKIFELFDFNYKSSVDEYLDKNLFDNKEIFNIYYDRDILNKVIEFCDNKNILNKKFYDDRKIFDRDILSKIFYDNKFDTYNNESVLNNKFYNDRKIFDNRDMLSKIFYDNKFNHYNNESILNNKFYDDKEIYNNKDILNKIFYNNKFDTNIYNNRNILNNKFYDDVFNIYNNKNILNKEFSNNKKIFDKAIELYKDTKFYSSQEILNKNVIEYINESYDSYMSIVKNKTSEIFLKNSDVLYLFNNFSGGVTRNLFQNYFNNDSKYFKIDTLFYDDIFKRNFIKNYNLKENYIENISSNNFSYTSFDRQNYRSSNLDNNIFFNVNENLKGAFDIIENSKKSFNYSLMNENIGNFKYDEFNYNKDILKNVSQVNNYNDFYNNTIETKNYKTSKEVDINNFIDEVGRTLKNELLICSEGIF